MTNQIIHRIFPGHPGHGCLQEILPFGEKVTMQKKKPFLRLAGKNIYRSVLKVLISSFVVLNKGKTSKKQCCTHWTRFRPSFPVYFSIRNQTTLKNKTTNANAYRFIEKFTQEETRKKNGKKKMKGCLTSAKLIVDSWTRKSTIF